MEYLVKANKPILCKIFQCLLIYSRKDTILSKCYYFHCHIIAYRLYDMTMICWSMVISLFYLPKLLILCILVFILGNIKPTVGCKKKETFSINWTTLPLYQRNPALKRWTPKVSHLQRGSFLPLTCSRPLHPRGHGKTSYAHWLSM